MRTDGFEFGEGERRNKHIKHNREQIVLGGGVKDGVRGGGGRRAKVGVEVEEEAIVHKHSVSEQRSGRGRRRGKIDGRLDVVGDGVDPGHEGEALIGDDVDDDEVARVSAGIEGGLKTSDDVGNDWGGSGRLRVSCVLDGGGRGRGNDGTGETLGRHDRIFRGGKEKRRESVVQDEKKRGEA